ncbi:MAG: Fe-S cluster assembly protein SufD [Gemmatimonadota bacterium]|nr:MAG: Fe-S cluster assembly protein SufD [Gemmatimonadota bacterium]
MTKALDVKDKYVSDFEAFSANGESGVPQWLQALRNEAIERFSSVGFPTTRDERWRFTSVARVAETKFALANGERPSIPTAEVRQHVLECGSEQVLVFINGRYSEELSSTGGVPEGVIACGLRQVTGSGLETVEHHLGKYARMTDNPFTALSTAFMADGAFLYVPSDTILGDPIQLLFLTASGGRPVVTHPRNLICLERGAAASVIESHVGLVDDMYWTNCVTEAVVRDNARLHLYRVQRESEQANHTATTQSYQSRDSNVALTTVELGSALSRHDINAVLDGEGAECSLYGLTQIQGSQHVDHHTTIEHAQPHCSSWEFFNGIYDEKARGVFTGRIVVHPGAQRTDSKQTNNNLLLSEGARADSQPQLEIYADDVKCTHGATLGPIDDKALFYLQTRGIDAEVARNLLTYGFGVEILNKIAVAELRERLDQLVHARLDDGAARRRAKNQC